MPREPLSFKNERDEEDQALATPYRQLKSLIGNTRAGGGKQAEWKIRAVLWSTLEVCQRQIRVKGSDEQVIQREGI